MSMLCVIWEASVLVGQLLDLQGGSAVGWVAKELSINFKQGKSFLLSSKHPDNSEASPASYSVRALRKVAGPGSKPPISV
jgi:hypothetical protein